MDEQFVLRIKDLVDKAGGQSALARKSGLSLGAIQRYLRGGDPSRKALVRLANSCGVTINWLIFGEENPDIEENSPPAIPLYGFGDSAGQGWFHEVKYQIKTDLEWPDPDVFAIVAPDRSMTPEGIKINFVCIVSPNTRPQKGDVVFIRRKDDTASLKIYEREDSEWCYARGFVDAGEDEDLVPSNEQVKRSAIKQMGPVIMVKRR